MDPMAPTGYGNRVEGVHAVAAAVAAGRVRRLWVESRRLGRSEISAVVGQIDPGLVSEVRDVRSYAETEVPQGLVAECDPILPVGLDSFAGEDSAVLVLDHIEDPHNVGAIARSAFAAGMGGLVVSRRRASPLSAVAFKAAAGALERLPVAIVGSIPEALSRLKEKGLWVIGLDAEGDSSLFGLNLLTEPAAVVVGAESAGLSTLVRKRCDVLASIPMTAGAGSLNASVSAALASFEIPITHAGLAQLVEQLICNQQVIGSTPVPGSPESPYDIRDFAYRAPSSMTSDPSLVRIWSARARLRTASRSAARASISEGNRCPYRSMVTDIDEWPRCT